MAPWSSAAGNADASETPRKGSNGPSSGWSLNPIPYLFSPRKSSHQEEPKEREEEVEQDAEQEYQYHEQGGFPPIPVSNTVQQRGEGPGKEESLSEEGSPVPIEPPNRKRPAPRDEYAIDDFEPEEPPVLVNKRAKRQRTARKPIVQPKTSRGSAVHSTRRAHAPAPSFVPEESYPTPASDPAITNGNTNEVEGQSKKPTPRKRGRPPKDRGPVPAISALEAQPEVEDVEEETGMSKSPRKMPPPGSDEGITDIIMNPSPIKPPHVPEQVRNQIQTQKASNEAKPNMLPEISDNSGDADERSGTEIRKAAEEKEDLFIEDIAEERPLIDIRKLRDILAIAKRVGCKEIDGEWRWQNVARNEKKKREKLLTIPSKWINRQTVKLAKEYAALRKAKGDRNEAQATRTQITSTLKSLKQEIDAAIKTRLDMAEEQKQKICALLIDIYYIHIPSLLGVVLACAEATGMGGTMNDHDLQEFELLIHCVHDLGTSATQQDTKYQPSSRTTSKGTSYQISKPTRGILPVLRDLLKDLNKEVSTRERQRKIAESKSLDLERERRRKEKAARDELEGAHRRKEVHRRQREVMKAKLLDGFWGAMLSNELAKADGKTRPPKSKRQPSRTYLQTHESESNEDIDESDPFAENEAPERISVFGSNNVNDTTRSKPLTYDDKLVFVDIMRYKHEDADKYEEAAQTLGRSMDEIFAFAKDLQESMDKAHERGEYNDVEKDAWTYDVYTDLYSGD